MENQQNFSNNFNQPIALPNAQAVLVLGIISIASCFVYGIPGLVCGIIAIVLSKRDLKLYNESPEKYTVNSFSNLKAGKTCAIIGVSLSAACIIFIVIYVAIMGAFFLKIFEEASRHQIK